MNESASADPRGADLGSASIYEMIAAVLTGLGKLLLVDLLHQKFLFIAIALISWVGYVLYRSRTYPSVLADWGFTSIGCWSGVKMFLPVAVLCVIGFIVYGHHMDVAIWSWHMIPILLLYPLWGVIQQFLVVGLIAGNLSKMRSPVLPRWIIVLFTATMFAIVHYPSVLLIVATFIMGVVYTIFYLRQPNLWVLGLYHGWLGGLFYFLVLGRDPYLEVFGSF